MQAEVLCLQTDKICHLANTVFPVTILTWKLKIERPLSVKQTAACHMRSLRFTGKLFSLFVELQLSSIFTLFLRYKAMFYTFAVKGNKQKHFFLIFSINYLG